MKSRPKLWLDSSRKAFEMDVDNREFDRIPAGSEAKLHVLGAQQRTLQCRIENVSIRGFRVTVPAPIPIGSPVVVTMARLWLMGEVVYCQTLLEGYALGLKLEHQLDQDALQEIQGKSSRPFPEPD